MQDQVTQIHIASSLLRSPQLFDGLGPPDKPGVGPTRIGRRKYGAATGGFLRDIILYAAWQNEEVCELRLPDFCKMMGYDSSNLTRSCTEEEREEIKRTGWPEEWVEPFCNVLGLALVRLVRNNFILRDKNATADHTTIGGSKIVEHIDVYEARSTGTLLTFTLSKAILSQNRRRFQTPILEEYLSLRTESKTRQEGHPGHPDDAARRMYLRLTWHRQYYNYLVSEGRHEDARNHMADKYGELVAVAGLSERRKYWPEKRVAAELRKLLQRVGSMASIRLVPEVKLKRGFYEVQWSDQVVLDAAEPQPSEWTGPCEPAPASWGSAPAPGTRPTRPARKAKRAHTSAQIKPVPPKAKPAQRVNQPNRQRLLEQLEDQTKRVQWLQSDVARKVKPYAEQPELLGQHLEAAKAELRQIQEQL